MKKIRIKYIILILGALLSGVAPFIHKFFPKKDAQLLQVELKYENNSISKIEYETSKKELKKRYFHFGTVRNFLIAIGNRITLLFSACIMLMSIPYINQKEIQRIVTIASLILFSISCYWIIWAFWYQNDFPTSTYQICLIIISIASTFLAYHLIVHQNKVQRYLGIIRKLTTFVIVDIREKYIQTEDRKSYTKDITNLTDNF